MMDDNDNEFEEEGGLIDRIKESPRTVSALIIILIVAAAIYAFSGEEEGGQITEAGEQTEVATEVDSETTKEEGQEEDMKEIADKDDTSTTEKREPKVAAETTTTEPQAVAKKEVTKVEKEPLAEPSRTDKGFVEVAEAGNGITHLARRASSRWLSENQAGYAVTDEHRIYIEDYIQRKIATPGLAYGDTVEIGFDTIQEAVMAAQELTESQLQNLSQYTHVLQ
jgi:hypothetical protein